MSIIEERLRVLGDSADHAPNIGAVIARGERIRRQRRNRRLVITAGVATAVLLVVPVMSVAGHRPLSTSAASEFLNSVAARAAAQQSADASKAAYWYSKTDVLYGGKHFTRESWQGHYAPGYLIQNDGIIGSTDLDKAVFPAGSTGLTWDQLFALPRNPDTLYDWLHKAVGDAGNDPDSEMFVAIGDLLRESPAPPSLRQTLFEVAARIPGVDLTTGVTDALGRPATAVSRANPDRAGSVRYLIDASTGALLEEQDINPDGTTAFRATLLASGPAANKTIKIPSE